MSYQPAPAPDESSPRPLRQAGVAQPQLQLEEVKREVAELQRCQEELRGKMDMLRDKMRSLSREYEVGPHFRRERIHQPDQGPL